MQNVGPGVDADSDHKLFMMKNNIVFMKPNKTRNKMAEKWNLQILKDLKNGTASTDYSNAKLGNLL